MNVYKSEYEGYEMYNFGWSVVIAANSIDEAYKLAKDADYTDEEFKLELVEGLVYNLPIPKIISRCWYYYGNYDL